MSIFATTCERTVVYTVIIKFQTIVFSQTDKKSNQKDSQADKKEVWIQILLRDSKLKCCYL